MPLMLLSVSLGMALAALAVALTDAMWLLTGPVITLMGVLL